MFSKTRRLSLLALAPMTLMCAACDDADDEPGVTMAPFALNFAAVANGAPVTCTDAIAGLGPDGAHSIGLSDLRFYVSNVRFEDADGQPVPVELESNDFQLIDDAGTVAMIDLTSTAEGTCGADALARPEGTARTNPAVRGMTELGRVARVRFDVGVPQGLMAQTIANNTEEAAPSPLNEMYWSWASGYRHFVFNFAVTTDGGETGDGYVHIGSRDCGDGEGKALADRETCGLLNTPQVALDDFDLATDTVQVDLTALLESASFVVPMRDPETSEVIGEATGVACHSTMGQADCAPVMSALGLDGSTGAAGAASNRVFGIQ